MREEPRDSFDVTFRVFARKWVAIKMIDIANLYERYAGDVRRFALYLCGDVAMADEMRSPRTRLCARGWRLAAFASQR
jgi:hypothetical protein